MFLSLNAQTAFKSLLWFAFWVCSLFSIDWNGLNWSFKYISLLNSNTFLDSSSLENYRLSSCILLWCIQSLLLYFIFCPLHFIFLQIYLVVVYVSVLRIFPYIYHCSTLFAYFSRLILFLFSKIFSYLLTNLAPNYNIYYLLFHSCVNIINLSPNFTLFLH